MVFQSHIPFLDSRIVQDMIKKESYGYNVFAGLRVAEIQQKTDATAWRHIGSKENIADVLTRGVSPGQLGPGSTWQTGPVWLSANEADWPVTKVTLESEEVEIAQKFERAVRSARTQISYKLSAWTCLSVLQADLPVDFELDQLISRCGWLEKLIRATAYVLRLVGRYLRLRKTPDCNVELVGSKRIRYLSSEISAVQ